VVDNDADSALSQQWKIEARRMRRKFIPYCPKDSVTDDGLLPARQAFLQRGQLHLLRPDAILAYRNNSGLVIQEAQHCRGCVALCVRTPVGRIGFPRMDCEH
jgi:hypothetical protein